MIIKVTYGNRYGGMCWEWLAEPWMGAEMHIEYLKDILGMNPEKQTLSSIYDLRVQGRFARRLNLARDLACCLQVTRLRQADADVLHRRFDDEACDVATGQRALERGRVVVRDNDGVTEDSARDASG